MHPLIPKLAYWSWQPICQALSCVPLLNQALEQATVNHLSWFDYYYGLLLIAW